MAKVEKPKNTVQHRYKVASKAKDFNREKFCGTILAEHIDAAKDVISRAGKLWNKKELGTDGKPTDKAIFPKSDKAYDYLESELVNHVKNMVSQLRNGATKITANLEPAPF